MNSWIVRLIEQSGYLGIGFLMFLETIFPPIPSELIMTAAGLAVGHGNLSLPGIIGSGTAGAMLGNILWYLAARALGVDRFRPFVLRWGRWLGISWAEVRRSERWFQGHGFTFVLVARMVPTIRSLVSVPAGLLKMRFRTFVIASTIGTAGWTGLLAVAGRELGDRYTQIDDFLGVLSVAVLAALALVYVWRVWTHRHMHPGDESIEDHRPHD